MNYECIICLDNENNKYYTLSCKHKFHYACIYDWVVKYRNRYCPICNQRQSPVKIKKKELVTIISKKSKKNISKKRKREN